MSFPLPDLSSGRFWGTLTLASTFMLSACGGKQLQQQWVDSSDIQQQSSTIVYLQESTTPDVLLALYEDTQRDSYVARKYDLNGALLEELPGSIPTGELPLKDSRHLIPVPGTDAFFYWDNDNTLSYRDFDQNKGWSSLQVIERSKGSNNRVILKHMQVVNGELYLQWDVENTTNRSVEAHLAVVTQSGDVREAQPLQADRFFAFKINQSDDAESQGQIVVSSVTGREVTHRVYNGALENTHTITRDLVERQPAKPVAAFVGNQLVLDLGPTRAGKDMYQRVTLDDQELASDVHIPALSSSDTVWLPNGSGYLSLGQRQSKVLLENPVLKKWVASSTIYSVCFVDAAFVKKWCRDLPGSNLFKTSLKPKIHLSGNEQYIVIAHSDTKLRVGGVQANREANPEDLITEVNNRFSVADAVRYHLFSLKGYYQGSATTPARITPVLRESDAAGSVDDQIKAGIAHYYGVDVTRSGQLVALEQMSKTSPLASGDSRPVITEQRHRVAAYK